MSDIIKCENAAFAYDGVIVTENLNFAVNEGDFLCIIGENGSGKSTLVKGILGLKKPCEGKISFGGGLKQNEIGYLPQQTVVQKDFPAAVKEVVLSGCRDRDGFRPFYTKEQKALAEKNMERLKISELKNHCYRELSGGQQQRVLLARALCAAKRAILLDEPTAGLDPFVTKEFYELIEKLNKEDGLAVIMVSHDIQHVFAAASHVLYVKGNESVYGTVEEFKKGSLKAFLSEGGDGL
jgi:zinc transport system ATP-binding protein